MNPLLDQIKRAKNNLVSVDTRVKTVDGREYVERRDEDGSTVADGYQVDISHWGFVEDFSPDIQFQVGEVTPHVLVGSQDVAQDLEMLKELRVSHVLNVATGAFMENFFESDFTYKRLLIYDLPTSDIRQHFADAIAFMEECIRAGGRVFVHCNAGISRSVTICCAFLMKTQRLTARESLERLRAVRPCARPNEGFMRQLREYEVELQQQQLPSDNSSKI